MDVQKSCLPALTLVIGGASCGKSDFAEQLVIADGRPRYYVATAQAFDDEMRAKIAAHKAARKGVGWHTIEEPLALAQTLPSVPKGAVTLIDCATLWLTNLVMSEADIAAQTAALLSAVNHDRGPTVIVSNEVGQGIVPENRMARQFRGHQGALNRKIAAQADLVVQVVAGIPLVLKGALPGGSL